mgnify:FL=1
MAVEGDDYARRAAFATALLELQNRISIFVNLPFDSLDNLSLQKKLDEIGHIRLVVSGKLAARP